LGFGAGSVGSSGAPPSGAIIMFGGDDAPDGYVLCDGAAISRTTFVNLFNEIGTNFGIGDGATTFNVPDFRTDERYPSGAVNNAAVGDEEGSRTIEITNLPAHNHPITPDPHTHTSPVRVPAGGASGLSGVGNVVTNTGATSLTSDMTGGDSDYDLPNVKVNFIIKT